MDTFIFNLATISYIILAILMLIKGQVDVIPIQELLPLFYWKISNSQENFSVLFAKAKFKSSIPFSINPRLSIRNCKL